MKIKRNKKSYKWFLCGLILVVVLTISYRVSKANYRISNSIELTTGKVISSPYDFNLVSMYIDGVEQDKDTIIPDSGYAINEEQSYCYKESKNNKDNNARLFTDSLGNHVFKGISKGTKCIIYFDKTKTMEELLNNYYTDKRIRTSENKDFNVPYEEETTKTIFSAPDDDGTSYYFAGNPTDNWIEFGGYYWRIIRVNGNGSIRMIYQGRTEDENGKELEPQATGEETQIGTSAFNEQNGDNAYIGFMYGTPNSNTHELTHENKNDSTVKNALDNWFNISNLKKEQYFNKIDLNAGFCGDRTPYTDTNGNMQGGGAGTTETYYGASVRTKKEAVNPTFNCSNVNDLYTYNGSTLGNKKLINPVGMITADEVVYAGIYSTPSMVNTYNYLYIGPRYWTMSPIWFGDGWGSVDLITASGYIGHDTITSIGGIRPVINLRSDVTFTGDGTISNPFKVN